MQPRMRSGVRFEMLLNALNRLAVKRGQRLFSSMSRASHRKLLIDLEDLGFFRYTSPERASQNREMILQLGWPGIFCESGRLFIADAEELAEGGVSAFVTEIALFLENQGVEVPPMQDELGDEYVLLAGGERVPIWTRSEYQRELVGEPGLCWGCSAARTVQLINNWLERAGSAERAYGVEGGNDFAVIFLTTALYQRICDDADVSAHHGPYILTLDYPSFGQPDAR